MRIGVIGAGVMGSGIAQVLATAGHEVHCSDIAPEALDKAREHVTTGRFGLEGAIKLGKLDREAVDATLARLHFTTDFEAAVSRAELVVECVPERLDLKVRIFRQLDAVAPADCILASNSSGFPVAALAAATDRPERVLTWHWASPPVVMKFAEIVVTDRTDQKVIERVCKVALECRKHPIVVKDQPMAWGYVANRVYAAMLREAARVAEEGLASQEEVNQLMVDCFRWPVGPFGLVKGAQSGWD